MSTNTDTNDRKGIPVQFPPSRLSDSEAIDMLTDFVRTPEWSVSMLEDIAEIVRAARPEIGPDYDDEDPRAWYAH